MKCSDEELLQVNARDKVVCLKTGQKSIPQRVAAAFVFMKPYLNPNPLSKTHRRQQYFCYCFSRNSVLRKENLSTKH